MSIKDGYRPKPGPGQERAIWLTVTSLDVEDVDALKSEIAKVVSDKIGRCGNVSAGVTREWRLKSLRDS